MKQVLLDVVEGLAVVCEGKIQLGGRLAIVAFTVDPICNDLAVNPSGLGPVTRQTECQIHMGAGSDDVPSYRLATGPQACTLLRRIVHDSRPQHGSVIESHRRYGEGVVHQDVVLLPKVDGLQRDRALARIRYRDTEPVRLGLAGQDPCAYRDGVVRNLEDSSATGANCEDQCCGALARMRME